MSDVIDFLLDLLRDETRLAAFEEDPEGELAEAGLDGLTGQDVRDAQLVMADTGAARPSSDGGGGGGGGGGDAVSQITHVTRNYHAAPETTIVQVDDRDTFINDSFNSDDDITVINAEDSFNSSVENDVIAIQDNDVIVRDNVVEDNDTIEDNDSVVVEGGPEPLRSEGIRTEDIVGPEEGPEEPEPVVEAEVEPVPDEAEPEPEPEPEPDQGADLDAAVV